MLRKRRLRAAVLKDTRFIIRGKSVSLAALQRYATRNHINLDSLIYSFSRSDDVVRKAIECLTPPGSPLPIPDVYDGAMKFRCLVADILSCSPEDGDTSSELIWRTESPESETYRSSFRDKLTSTGDMYRNGKHALATYYTRKAFLEVENIIKHWDCYTFVDWLDCLHDFYTLEGLDTRQLLQAHAKSWSEATLPSSDLRRHLLTTLADIDSSQLQQAIEDVGLAFLDKLDGYSSDENAMNYRIWLGQSKLRNDRMLPIDDYLPTREAVASRFGTGSSTYRHLLVARYNTLYWRNCYMEAEEVAQHLLDTASTADNPGKSIYRASRAYDCLSCTRIRQGTHRLDEARAAAQEALSSNDDYRQKYTEMAPPLSLGDMVDLTKMLEDIAQYDGKDEEAAYWTQKRLELLTIPDDDIV